jgi:hypothetical protein
MEKRFTIRDEQMQALQRAQEEAFVRSVSDGLRNYHLDLVETIPEEQLLAMVARGIDRARRYGIRQKFGLAMFVELMLLVGEDFDEYPPIRAILLQPDIDPDDKMDRIIDTMTEPQWQGARRRSAPSAWSRPVEEGPG